MNLNRIEKLIGGKLKNKDDQYAQMCYVLCKEFHWDYFTLMQQPIDFVMMLMKQRNRDIERQNKQMKKGRKR